MPIINHQSEIGEVVIVQENACRIDDFGPLTVVRPQGIAEVGDLVHRAAAEGQALYPLGGQTQLNVGLPPSRPGYAVDLRGLAKVIDYPARDMTITVQAGITLTELQTLLAKENQRLPIDVPQPERATLGGTLAANISGPRRLGFGTLRDYVIGITTVNDEGQEVKAGGRVVKNVAGYDLCKLHIGALGTLGIISQVTLKLRPRPEGRALVTLGCETAALAGLLDQLHQTRTRPVCLDVLNRSAAGCIARDGGISLPDAPWVIVIGFEDNAEAVGWQVRQLLQEIAPREIQGVEARAGDASDSLWRSLVEFTAGGVASAPREPHSGRSRDPARQDVTFKANLLPHAVASFCQQAATLPEPIRLHAHAGSGIVWGHLDGDLTRDRVAAMLKELTDSAVRAEGNLVLPRCPVEWKRELPVWGRPRGDLWLMRQVKQKLDPRDLFNPGRFLLVPPLSAAGPPRTGSRGPITDSQP
jgi:glycolate oxidase FAD binding subunit